MGVGNIEDAQDIEAGEQQQEEEEEETNKRKLLFMFFVLVWSFYRDVASRAKQRGVPISVISIAGFASLCVLCKGIACFVK
jgi:hypothetical protein